MLGWTCQWINNSIIRKSICFLFTKKRAIISSTAAPDMKLIIAVHCFILKLTNAPSLKLYTHACDIIHEKSTVRTNHRLIAWLHQVIHYLQGIKKYVVLVIHLHPLNQSQEKAYETYPYGKSSQVYLFPDVWFWQCHLLRSNHEWDWCASTFCSCRQLTHSWVSDSHLQKFLYFA